MKPGLFISFEGIEGCGKTTQISKLAETLTEKGVAHTVTREPGGTAVGEGIRQILLDSETIHLTPAAELLLFYASRSQNIEENIRPALKHGDVVICDRFFDASLAYQGYGRGLPLKLIDELTELVCAEHRPELTILLDIEPEIGLARARARNSGQSKDEGRFEAEDLEFYQRVRKGYLELARRSPERIKVVPAAGSIEAIAADVNRILGVD
jgi:dTMP kinase